jgi:hypothetical protein
MKTKFLFALLGLLLSTTIFAQSKDLAKIYDQLDSLENRKLELKRENDKAILDCLDKQWWKNSWEATGCRMNYAGQLEGIDWRKATEYRNEICECYVGKKHEIEAVETKIKQLERRIGLINNSKPNNKQSDKPAQKDDSKPAQNVKK